MATPSSTISMNDINKELNKASPYNQTVSLNDADVRRLAGSGYAGDQTEISMNIMRNKSNSIAIDLIVVGGGGGGGTGIPDNIGGAGGGGGGGGVFKAITSLVSGATYDVVIGGGGAAGSMYTDLTGIQFAGGGGATTFSGPLINGNSVTVTGYGGYPGQPGNKNPGYYIPAGTSGWGGNGAGSEAVIYYANGTTNTLTRAGNSGGINGQPGGTNGYGGGGGGGGVDDNSNANGYGGDGPTWVDGVYRGGGGGGGSDGYYPGGGAGGAGGGGHGGIWWGSGNVFVYPKNNINEGTSAQASTGGGGGGGASWGSSPTWSPGGAGGSGVVIIRYLGTDSRITSSTGTLINTYVMGGYVYNYFRSSGTFVLT